MKVEKKKKFKSKKKSQNLSTQPSRQTDKHNIYRIYVHYSDKSSQHEIRLLS